MKHLGDITKIDGHNVPLVDIVCGGSPCQDLSVAGLRKGMRHSDKGDEETTRSGLFMEQIRVIKEMRDESTKQLRSRGSVVDFRCVQPRFMVWENVLGAFSSNDGNDFHAVLEETAKIADESAFIPRLEGGAKWTNSGCILADRWSIAWRVHDAQFWGVPQRRKRIALVADFAGQSAPEILFERKGLSGDSEQSEQTGEETTRTFRGSTEDTDKAFTLKIRGGVDVDRHGKRAGKGALVQTERSGTLGVSQDQTLITLGGGGITQGFDGYNQTLTNDKSKTITSGRNDTHNIPCVIQGVDMYNQALTNDKTMSITGSATDTHHIPCVMYEAYQHHGYRKSEISNPLTRDQNTSIRGDTSLVVEGEQCKHIQKKDSLNGTKIQCPSPCEIGGGHTD